MAELLKVGDKIIPATELLALLSRYEIMPQFLRGMTVDRVIADVELSEEEETQALYQFRSHHKIISDEDMEKWQRDNKMSHERMAEVAIRPFKLEKFKQTTFAKKLETYFMEQKGRLDRVVYSLIRVSDEGLANEIYYRIEEGEATFAEMAQEYSEGPEANTQGILGPVPVNQPHPFIAKMLSVSQPGQLWPPRAIASWFIIVRLEQFISAQLDDTMRRQLLNEMFEKRLGQETDALGLPLVVDEMGEPVAIAGDDGAGDSTEAAVDSMPELTPEPA